jgi:hypothetical protein
VLVELELLLEPLDELPPPGPLDELELVPKTWPKAQERLRTIIVVTPQRVEKYYAVILSRLPKYWITPELLMKVCQPLS